MSNDLINRKALYERIEKSMYENPHSDSKVRQIHNHEHAHFLCMIMQEPTAFDKERVIKQIKVLSTGIILDTHICKDYAEGYVRAAKDIIEIIGKGGIDTVN